MKPTVRINERAARRLRAGHLWVFRGDLREVQAQGGDTVRVVGPGGRPLGHALYSDSSLLALRFLSRGQAPADLSLWRARLEAALEYRRQLGIDATAYRLVNAEADLLPALIVDRYGDHLVVQSLAQGVERLLPDLTAMLVELLSPAGILARNDPKVRQLEGLERRVECLHGQVPRTVTVEEGGVRFEVDLWRGQKTGLFLDQRENRTAARAYARGRLLDAFSYVGSFALRLADRCREVLAVEISDESTAAIRRNAALNGVTHLTAQTANVFDLLRELERAGERFDTVVLDPPAFAKNKAAVPRALAGYKEINLRALKLLSPGGHLITCSCSYHVDEARFAAVLREAAADVGVRVAVVEQRPQGRDHPVLLGVPETRYLKCFILRRLP